METVKDFLDAGLVFVDGDLCKDVNGAMLGAFWYQYLGQNEWMNSWYDGRLHEFAWRANTGKKPGFSGEIAVEYRDGKNDVGIADCFAWSIDEERLDIISWRPVISKESKMEDELAAIELAERVELASDGENLIDLDGDLDVRDALEKLQQEAKPTYTKEMQEAGELPPVGSKFMLARKANCQRIDQFQGVECEVIGQCKSKAGCDVIVFSNPLYGFTCMNHLPVLIKPIQTDEERLIDGLTELFDDMQDLNKMKNSTKAKATVAWLKDKGYLSC